MFVLVEVNKYLNETILECKKHNFTVIPLFTLNLTTKEDIQEQIKQIKLIKNKINMKHSAIRVVIFNFSNSLVGNINSLKKDFDLIVGFGGLNKLNRFFLEQTQIDFLEDPQNSQYKPKMDFIHHFNSGLNHVLCNLAKEKNVGIINSLNFVKLKPIFIAKEIGRINQNTKFARKYNIPILSNIISNKYQVKNQNQLNNINSILGLDNNQKKDSLNVLEEKINLNNFKKSSKYVGEGVFFE